MTRTALLLLVLRSLVPPGFMPSVDALRDGRIEVVLCTGGGGLKTLVLDTEGNPVPPDHRQSYSADACAFGTVTASAFLLPDAPPQAAAALPARDRAVQFANAALKPPAQGPPLGSRAPPIALG